MSEAPVQNIMPPGQAMKIVPLQEVFKTAVDAHQSGDVKKASELYITILKSNPNVVNAWNNLGFIFTQEKKYQSALICFKKAYEKSPDMVMFGVNVINTLITIGRVDEALRMCEQMLQKYPDHQDILPSYNNALREDGQFGKAYDVLNIAKAQRPNHPPIDWGRGQNLLSVGRYDEGFRLYESRYLLGTNKLPNKDFGCPRWLGVMDDPQVDITGKIILLHEEQGFGDTIMAARFVRMVKQKVGPNGTVILQCKPHLLRLLRDAGADLVIGVNQVPGTNNIPMPDYHTLVMSLPGAFGIQPATVPPPATLHIPEAARQKFAFIGKQYPKDQFPDLKKIGIVWYGSDSFESNHKRSIGLDALLPFAENPNIKFYSLQKEPYLKQLYETGAQAYIEDIGQHCVDFADTAAVIEQMDFIVMSDSSVAHLAGTMGKRIVNIVHKSPYWVYPPGEPKTPWYPSMELIMKDELHKIFENF